MSEAARREEALRSAVERLPFAVVLVDTQKRVRPFNQKASELFEREALRGDLMNARPSHPLSRMIADILDGKPLDERILLFQSGARYRVEPSRRSEKGMGRWLMLLMTPMAEEPAQERLDAFEFTSRERDVARLLVSGADTADICEQLSISRDTLKSHMKRLLEKSGARNRAEFVVKILGR